MSAELVTEHKPQPVLQFSPFSRNGEVIIEALWNIDMSDELIVTGFFRQFENSVYIIPSLIPYCSLAFYAQGNALNRPFTDLYDITDDISDKLYDGKFSKTYKCRKLNINTIDNENVFVVKILDKTKIQTHDIKCIQKEIQFLKQIRKLKTKCIEGSQYIITGVGNM
eukprot:367409_1